MTNHLADAASPYLLQHAGNPVDLYPWGEAALRKARVEQRPIFLSIGYSACHWAHVMAHESFDDVRIAAILNKHFVSIKVDREERPDLDQIYMTAVQTMTGSGGWPTSVFLTPDGHPFYGGTYFPPAPRYGLPSFTQVLQAIVDAWQNRRQELVSGEQRLVEAIGRQSQMQPAPGQLGPRHKNLDHEVLHAAFRILRQQFDRGDGGWNGAPKFPQPMVLESLLRYHHATGDADALDMVIRTLEAMARGGIYDQLGGGFHRYSVDDRWGTPHFERMLYDEAQLARVYLHAWQVTREPLYRAITDETLDYVVREMTDPAGGFYSTQDADSEGEEGRFFLWTKPELHAALRGGSDLFLTTYRVAEQANFEGKNILHLAGGLDQRSILTQSRRKLFSIREQRVHPNKDEKILTSWNGLMLAALAEAARALNRSDYLKVAERNADFLLREVGQADGCLLHVWKSGKASITGYLEDYSCLVVGLLELHQTTFDLRWYLATRALTETMLTHFQAADGTLWDTSDDHETLIARPRELQDNATPSGNSMAATTLLRLAGLTGESRYVELAYQALSPMQPLMAQYSAAFGQWLVALDYALSRPCGIAIVGIPQALDARQLIDTCTTGYHPHQVVAVRAPGLDASPIPLLENRGQIDGHATAYVCTDLACQSPITDPAELRDLYDSESQIMHGKTKD